MTDITKNMLIGFPRWTDTCTFSGGSYTSAYPVTNLNTLPLTQVARSTDATNASTQWTLTLSTPQLVNAIAFCGHNAAQADQFQVKLWSDHVGGTLLADSGVQPFFASIVSWGVVPYGDPHWWNGLPTLQDIQGFNITTAYNFGTVVGATAAISVQIFCTTNPAGYFQCGLFEVTQTWQLGINPAPGYEYGLTTRSLSNEALGGATSVQLLPSQRTWQGTIAELAHIESMAQWLRMWKQYDIGVPFLMWLDPKDSANAIFNTALVRNVDPGLAKRAFPANDETPLHFMEVL